MTNDNLHKSRYGNKTDEFYTLIFDIEDELKHYSKHFENKTVLCNCDDFRSSSFYHYFSSNFEKLKLKKLITISFKSPQMDLWESKRDPETGLYFECTGFKSNDQIKIHSLEGSGDFRSKECIEILKKCDIVVTNPPFSLFKEFMYQLMEYEKKFLIIGNMNVIANRKIFSFIYDNKIWCGHYSGSMDFMVPHESKLKNFGNICWFTNLGIKKRHEKLDLSAKYIPENYPKYNNSEIINVDKIKDIPTDYDGLMGVPLTFIHKHNPDQFKILGLTNAETWFIHKCIARIGKRNVYNRIIIQKRLH